MLLARVFNNILITVISLLITGYSPCFADNNSINHTIRLATTTSTENSGLLLDLLSHFTKQTGYTVHVIAVGTGKALRMGRDGDVDVVLVHAPSAEAEFVNNKYGVKRHQVMYNDFVIIGPDHDPAGIKTANSTTDAMKRIAKNAVLFISRGDDSGTHKKELSLWNNGNITPENQWYRIAGQSMGKVIQIASELDAYTLADRGTWLAYKNKSPLNILFQGDPALHNPYGIIAVSPQRYPDINYKGAQSLIQWMTSETGQSLIDDFRITGHRLFIPAANIPSTMVNLE